MENKNIVKEIVKNNKKYLILHWILISLISLDMIFKLISGFSVWEGSIFFVVLLLFIILLFSGIALIGLLLYKTWGYWVVLLLVFNTLNGELSSPIQLAMIAIIYLPIPIYLLYKISQEKKLNPKQPINKNISQ